MKTTRASQEVEDQEREGDLHRSQEAEDQEREGYLHRNHSVTEAPPKITCCTKFESCSRKATRAPQEAEDQERVEDLHQSQEA